ncbi:MAG: hypothetical protein LAO03_00605 [Acidobacteriia bacterium]|nr:hypothetical protein [Terriglobia bacterium]
MLTAALICFCLVLVSVTQAQKVRLAPGTVFVHTALGGFILGYDIDSNGTEGVLAEAVSLPDGNFDVAVETFDQSTGMILKMVKQLTETQNDFVALGIFGNNVGLIEFEKVKGGFVNQRVYGTMNPVNSGKITGMWTPPLQKGDLILGMGNSQGAANTVVLAARNFSSFVFSSDVANNTFGPTFTLSDSIFAENDSPVVDIDTQTNEAIVAASNGGVFSRPQVAFVNLSDGTTTQIQGLGFGFVNGIAADSVKNRAVTTTEIDFSIEYYDVAKHASILVEPLHNATNQSQSGGAVAFDPVNKVFLVGQEFSSLAPSGSSIHVYNERGDFVEGINGLSLPASPAKMALNPNTRTGFVIVTPDLTSLQSFTY